MTEPGELAALDNNQRKKTRSLDKFGSLNSWLMWSAVPLDLFYYHLLFIHSLECVTSEVIYVTASVQITLYTP